MTYAMFLFAVLFCLFMMLIILNIFHLRPTINKKFVYTAIPLFILVLAVAIFFEANPMSVIMGGVLGVVVDLIFFKKDIKNAAALAIYAFLSLIGFNTIAILFLDLSGNIEWFHAHRQWGIVNIAIMVIIFMLSFLINRIIRSKFKTFFFNGTILNILVIISSVVLFFMYIRIAVAEDNLNIFGFLWTVDDLFFLIFFVSMVAMMIIVMVYIARESAINNEKMLNDANKKYIQDLESSYQSLRALKHDYINILNSFKLYIDTDDVDGLKHYYYNELLEMNNEMLHHDALLSSLHPVQNQEIKSILIFKCAAAEAMGINVSIEVRDIIDTFGISTGILCQIVGVFLDNAIEAAYETTHKDVVIALIKNPESKTIIIKNSWTRQAIHIQKYFELGFSTKGEARGIGLATVRNYTDKYAKLMLETEAEEDFFTQTLTIKD